jgi:hypothetical protein
MYFYPTYAPEYCGCCQMQSQGVDQHILAIVWFHAYDLGHPHIDPDVDYKRLVYHKMSEQVPRMDVVLWLWRTLSQTRNPSFLAQKPMKCSTMRFRDPVVVLIMCHAFTFSLAFGKDFCLRRRRDLVMHRSHQIPVNIRLCLDDTAYPLPRRHADANYQASCCSP